MDISRKKSLIWKISKEQFVEIIKNGTSFMEILSHFGLKNKGNNHKTLKDRINYEKLDISHIYENMRRRNKEICSNMRSAIKKPIELFLVEHCKVNRTALKKRLIREKILKEECEKCGIKNEWKGNYLSLVLDHKNGVSDDYRLDNLRLLCPNCNSQTDTFTGRNRKDKRTKRKCIKCGKDICSVNRSGFCFMCYHLDLCNFNKNYTEDNIIYKKIDLENKKINKRKTIWPTKEVLEKLITEKPFTIIGKDFGVSGSAIKKWCKKLGVEIPKNRRGYWTKIKYNKI
jgi:Zn finger protein HypA/HybF involved in hydrogenase expression